MKLSATDFDYIRTLVQKRSAIVLEPDKLYLAEARLLNLVRCARLGSLDTLMAQLRSNAVNGLVRKVVEAMTTNETSFFRDVHPFEALRQRILPELIRARAPQRRLQLWCGAASSGQEPYSVAILLREHFAELDNWQVSVLASDLSTGMLERCRQGRYNHMEVNRGLSVRLLVKYFEQRGLEWQVQEPLRRLLDVRELNLIEPWPPLPLMDIIFLRNVLIYLDVPTKKSILAKVRGQLRPDGYLFLGGAETTLNLDDAFERLELDKGSCYRLRGA